ncbi:MAG: phage major capsid protein [Ruminococcus flavefaciens]|nr:phage major capsid protein [Ruminococcus flavefaciens]MCM1232656.1 phage major capsid protein [Ruminococcus flavefaciens]
MNFKKLIEKRAELRAKMQSILGKAETEERAVTPEESAEFDSAEAEIRAIDETLAKADKARNIGDVLTPPETEGAENAEERAFECYIRNSIENRADGYNMAMGDNGAVIPESISNRIIDTVKDLCPILARADIYHTKGTLKIPKWTADSTHDITVGFAEDFQALTANGGKFDSVDLGGFLAGALTLIGKSLENNSAVNLVDFVVRKMSEKIAEFYENVLLNGSANTQGAVATQNAVTASKSDSVSFSDLVKLQSAVKQAYQKKACWTMSPETFTAVKLLTDTNGRPLLEPDATKEFPYAILGKPVYISDNMPKIGADSKSVLYGDYSGLSVNIREDISLQILREQYATQHALGIVAWFEFDSKITDEQKLAVLVHPSK